MEITNRNKYYQEYRKKPSWKKYHMEYARVWRKKHGTSKDTLRKKVIYALRRGELIKTPCEVCKNPAVEAHHDDYRSPLKINWLCRIHHRERDVLKGKRKH